jgi:hypothetical protein
MFPINGIANPAVCSESNVSCQHASAVKQGRYTSPFLLILVCITITYASPQFSWSLAAVNDSGQVLWCREWTILGGFFDIRWDRERMGYDPDFGKGERVVDSLIPHFLAVARFADSGSSKVVVYISQTGSSEGAEYFSIEKYETETGTENSITVSDMAMGNAREDDCFYLPYPERIWNIDIPILNTDEDSTEDLTGVRLPGSGGPKSPYTSISAHPMFALSCNLRHDRVYHGPDHVSWLLFRYTAGSRSMRKLSINIRDNNRKELRQVNASGQLIQALPYRKSFSVRRGNVIIH